MFKRIAVILCSVLVLALFSPAALASADVTPPQVSSITSDKATYHVGDTITVRVTASDAESGLSADQAMITLHHAQSPYNRITLSLKSLDEQAGVYTFVYPVTAVTTNGLYQLDFLMLTDKSGNILRSFEGDQLPAVSLAIDNPDQTDVTVPTLVSLSFSPDKGLRPGDKIHVTAKAQDASGLKECYISMALSTGFYYNNPARLLPTGKDTLEGDYVINSSMRGGNWSPTSIQIFDNANNMLMLYPSPGDFPSFEVINDAAPELLPLVTDIQVSSEEVTVGEKIKFTVLVDPRGNPLNDYMYLYVHHAQSQDGGAGPLIDLQEVEPGRYEGIWQTTPKLPFGEYFADGIQVISQDNVTIDHETSPSLYRQYEGQTRARLQRFVINSLFSGVDNKVLTVGQSFDPMAGITAGGGVEGDLTNATAVYGTVDTTKPGMYLLRYQVQGVGQTWNSSTGKYEPNVYMDFRWVGVSELPAAGSTTGEGSAEVLTNDALQIVVPDSSVKVDVQKDGSPIAYQRTNSAAGLYRATVNAGPSTASASSASLAATQSATAPAGKSMSGRVDRQGPTIEYSVSLGASSLLMNVKAKDSAGVKVLKWLPGWVSMADFTSKGTVFTGTMAITANSKYTIYAADHLGNKAIRQVQPSPNVTIAATANNTGYGTVSGGGSIACGASATVKATPKAGYRFVRWLEGSTTVSTGSVYKFTVTKARTLKAEFAKIGTPVVKAASAGYSSVKLTWPAVAGAKEYEIYRASSSGGTYSKIGTAITASYTSTGLTTGRTYYYKVRVKCVAGSTTTYGSYSAIAPAKPVPAAPTSVKAAPASYSSVKLTWATVAGATKYEVYRAASGTGAYTRLTTTASTSYTNTGLTAGKGYYYKVLAYRLVGSSKVYGSYSAVVSVKPVPAAPTGVKAARVSATSAKVSWYSVAGAMGYEVYRATASGGTYTLAKSVSTLSWTNTGLTASKTYYFKVRAYRLVGGVKVYGGYSTVVSAKP